MKNLLANKKALLTICIVLGVCIAVAIVSVVIINAGRYTVAIDTILDVQYRGKTEKLEALAPSAYWTLLEEQTGVTAEERVAAQQAVWETLDEKYTKLCGKDYQVSYKITQENRLDKDDVNTFTAALSKKLEAEIIVTEAVEVEIEVAIKGDKSVQERKMEFYAVKVDGTWYCISETYNFPDSFIY